MSGANSMCSIFQTPPRFPLFFSFPSINQLKVLQQKRNTATTTTRASLAEECTEKQEKKTTEIEEKKSLIEKLSITELKIGFLV